MSWASTKSLTECPRSDKYPKWLLPHGWPSQTGKAMAQHNIWCKPPAVCLTILTPMSFTPFLWTPNHLLWEDGVNEPHLLQHFSHLAFPFHPCSQTTHTHLITALSATAVFLTGQFSPFMGLSGHCCQNRISYACCGIYWPVSSLFSEEVWCPSFEDLLQCSSSH